MDFPSIFRDSSPFFPIGEGRARPPSSSCAAFAGLTIAVRVVARIDAPGHESILHEWIFGTRRQRRGEKPMTMLAILGIAIGVILVIAAIAYARRSRKNQEPLGLGVGRKLRS
jgi:hypothetical protein